MSEPQAPSLPLLPQAIDCPVCKLPTFRLKAMAVEKTDHYVVATVYKMHKVMACPRCMRKLLLEHHLGRLTTAEVFVFPIVLGQLMLQYLSTYTAGHSRVATQILAGETDPAKLVWAIPDALQGAMQTAGGAPLFGSVAGMLFGWITFNNLPDRLMIWDANLTSDLAAACATFIGGLFAGLGPRRFLVPSALAALGAAAWVAFRTWADARLGWRLGGTLFSWAVSGALPACLSGAYFGALAGGKGIRYPDVESAGGGWGPRTAGAVGGAVGGGLIGPLIGLFSGHLLAGLLLGLLFGSLGGALGGFFGGAAASKG